MFILNLLYFDSYSFMSIQGSFAYEENQENQTEWDIYAFAPEHRHPELCGSLNTCWIIGPGSIDLI